MHQERTIGWWYTLVVSLEVWNDILASDLSTMECEVEDWKTTYWCSTENDRDFLPRVEGKDHLIRSRNRCVLNCRCCWPCETRRNWKPKCGSKKVELYEMFKKVNIFNNCRPTGVLPFLYLFIRYCYLEFVRYLEYVTRDPVTRLTRKRANRLTIPHYCSGPVVKKSIGQSWQ